ncbi:hypothetical protein BWQ96_05599 [Gracilariopsis chorda]|uniref:Uncharacterized protein n=1 Tax=Gracilariopsis chorda TaxID=448386 RepID=A0A2V3ISD4_9FLOR|nr:hypothetical protein BWQ96_05599 [Gracilariopsis chorda]|eukprot:PXF44657.1 hypothetical protein BWQ96_05599 [Gracilariopsis chorda]
MATPAPPLPPPALLIAPYNFSVPVLLSLFPSLPQLPSSTPLAAMSAANRPPKRSLSNRLRNMRFMQRRAESTLRTTLTAAQTARHQQTHWQTPQQSHQPPSTKPTILLETGVSTDHSPPPRATCRRSFGGFNKLYEKQPQQLEDQPPPSPPSSPPAAPSKPAPPSLSSPVIKRNPLAKKHALAPRVKPIIKKSAKRSVPRSASRRPPPSFTFRAPKG